MLGTQITHAILATVMAMFAVTGLSVVINQTSHLIDGKFLAMIDLRLRPSGKPRAS